MLEKIVQKTEPRCVRPMWSTRNEGAPAIFLPFRSPTSRRKHPNGYLRKTRREIKKFKKKIKNQECNLKVKQITKSVLAEETKIFAFLPRLPPLT